MKKHITLVLLLTFSLFHFAVIAGDGTLKKSPIILDKSQVTWLGKKMAGQHDGAIKIQSGEVFIGGNEWRGGRFEIDMTTISNRDIVDAQKNAKLVGHLKSHDFFDVAAYPVSLMEITKVKRKSESEYEATADLTIKGIRHSVRFPVKMEVADGIASAKGRVMINRTEYGIRYGSGKFFQDLGDKLIHDDFEVNFDVRANL